MSAILAVKDLEKTFGSVVAARDISVAVPAQQTVGIIGANGAGKTTFVNMITGHLTPSKGSIHFEDRDITGLPSRAITRLGISRSFQIPQLFIELTAAENVIVAISGTGSGSLSFTKSAEADGRREKALALLDRLGLGAYADRPVSELAGGVRKLVDLAMAMARRPHLLLLDEPTSGVSAEEKFSTMDRVIHAVTQEAGTIVFVEHDMDIVTRYADRVLAFYSGRILADGEPDTVLKDNDVRRYVTGGAR